MAVGSGYITISNAGNITEVGFCWAEDGDPTVEKNSAAAAEPVQKGAFSVDLSGLVPATLYKGRAYVKIGETIYYGNSVEFATRELPKDGWCVIDKVRNVSVVTATADMQIADDGNRDILEYATTLQENLQ